MAIAKRWNLGDRLGDILTQPGEIGYVVAIDTFLQTFYIYSVHFIELGMVVGGRSRDLGSWE